MSDGISITLDVGDAMREIKAVGQRALEAAERALYEEAQSVMAESKGLVPVDTGRLKASGHVETPRDDGRTISVTLGYGGAASNYAEQVHEDLFVFHNVGQAKYLELPLILRQPQLQANIKERVKRAVEKG